MLSTSWIKECRYNLHSCLPATCVNLLLGFPYTPLSLCVPSTLPCKELWLKPSALAEGEQDPSRARLEDHEAKNVMMAYEISTP